MKQPAHDPLTSREFEALSEFRFQIRRFERFSENAVRPRGITSMQYLLLLHVKGCPGRKFSSIAELATRLQTEPHGVAALISRCEANGFVQRRQAEIHLLEEGERVLTQLAALHRAELRWLNGVFPIPLINF